jgi:transcriptional regulator with XRE-family HTH domain
MTMTLREHRLKTLRLTQDEMAARIGCSQPTISNVESGKMPIIYALSKFCEAYELTDERFRELVESAKSGGTSNEDQLQGVRDTV